jgi:hypothetical protein
LSPYAGRTITIEMHNANRRDWAYNTWTYVDNVQLINQPTLLYRVNLPLVVSGMTLGQSPPSPAAPVQRNRLR